MRWLFLLLVVLNVFYYVWHQQEAPLKVNEVHSISVSTDSKRTIQLLKEVHLINLQWSLLLMPYIVKNIQHDKEQEHPTHRNLKQ